LPWHEKLASVFTTHWGKILASVLCLIPALLVIITLRRHGANIRRAVSRAFAFVRSFWRNRFF
jgi:hypothetical protein